MKRDAAAALRRAAGGAAVAAAGSETASPALRLFSLLELIASDDRLFSLQSLAEASGWPKPTLHRMLQQLEAARLVQREGDGRHYGTGARLRRFAQELLAHDTLASARHRVLRALVEEVGESCNLTAFTGGEVVYLDRVETAAPLRFFLHVGSRVPAHCSASGKIFLAQMGAVQRERLLAAAPLERCTPATITEAALLEAELAVVRDQGYALDREEFLPGLVCLALPVPAAAGVLPRMCLALQAPVMRVPLDRVLSYRPALQRAARALAGIEA